MASRRAVPRVGFIVANLSRPAARVTKFYNGRGTAEQWIKEGKNAINWTRVRRAYARPLDGRSRLTLPQVPQQRVQAPASRARLQSRQRPAHAGAAAGGRALVHDHAAQQAHKDRRQGRADMAATSHSSSQRSPSPKLCSLGSCA